MEKFDDLITSNIPVLVDFYAEWCGPCKMMKPILEDVKAMKGEKVRVVKVDVDKHQELAAYYQIQSVPTLMIFKDGPPLQPERGLALGKPLELGEIERLFADFHLLIQPPFLGQIADAADVLRRETAAAEQNAAFVRSRDAVDDTDQRRLAGAVGTEQAVNGPPGNRERHVVQRGMRRIPLRHVLDT